jgi:small subunit ribosomal protein S17
MVCFGFLVNRTLTFGRYTDKIKTRCLQYALSSVSTCRSQEVAPFASSLHSFGVRVSGRSLRYSSNTERTIWQLCFNRSFSTNPSAAHPILVEDTIPFNSFIENIPNMSNEELEDSTSIPGWDLIHSPPRKYPRGALIGVVVSDKMDKTINVAVDRYKIVPKIRKRMKYTRKFMAHDESEVANMGDLVMITPCHRISKRKHFMLREIVKAKGQL